MHAPYIYYMWYPAKPPSIIHLINEIMVRIFKLSAGYHQSQQSATLLLCQAGLSFHADIVLATLIFFGKFQALD
jgi:hypothetical protein